MSCCRFFAILALSCYLVGQLNCNEVALPAQIDEDDLRTWMEKFENDRFFKQPEEPMKTSQKRQAPSEEHLNLSSLHDEIVNRLPDVYQSQIRFFPANGIMIQAMYKLMKPNGVLSKEGFSYSGKIQTNGAASILFSRPFPTEQALIDTLNQSVGKHLTDLEVAIGNFDRHKPLVVVTNYILNSRNTDLLLDWLRRKKEENGGHVRHTIVGRRLIMIVSYACCTQTVVPALSPKYGTIKVMIG